MFYTLYTYNTVRNRVLDDYIVYYMSQETL